MFKRPFRHPIITVALMALAMLVLLSPAQAQENPVYVNDSPAAQAMLRQAQAHIRDNAGEAVRLFQTLLEEYPMKLVPVADRATDHFVSVRSAVDRELRGNQSLLERYRSYATPEAQRMLASGDYERLAVTRPLTTPGLDAMLRLAQDELEAADFNGAITWLRQATEHPDFHGPHAAHAWYMSAIAAHYLNDNNSFERARAQLAELAGADPSLIEQLNQIAAEVDQPQLATGASVMTRTHPAGVNELIAQPIWSHRLDETLLHRRFVDPALPESRQSPALEQRRREADLQTSTATVCGDFVYVSEGFRITAFDRYMGDVMWRYIDTPSISLIDRDNDPALDLNVIAISGGNLITYTGHAHSDHRSGTGAVLCLNRFTGEKLWETKLDDIAAGEDVENLYPHGQPIIEGGSVFVLARKVSRQRLASAYAVALDLRTGRQRWSRYITSSAGLQRAGRPISSPAYRDGWLYLAEPIGALARLDATTGEIDWLRRFSVPITAPFQDQARRPWEFSAPVITSAGMIALQPDQRWISVIELNTGATLQNYPASVGDAWGEVYYLLGDELHIYAVGRDIRAFAIDNLARPLWALPPPTTSRAVDDRTFAGSPNALVTLRGRVQLTADLLVVPSLQGMQFVDRETGQVNHRLQIPPGNPVADDAQLISVGTDRIDAYMSFDRAQEMLRERIAARPDDPAPALSLMRLGIRAGDLGLTLSAADLAQRATQMSPELTRSAMAQDELFMLLLTIDEQQMVKTAAEAEALYAMLGSSASNPLQRVEYMLAYGKWLEDNNLGQAVEIYQKLLSDPQLADVARGRDRLQRAAAAWSVLRLQRLINTRGEQVYAAQSDFASRQLDQLVLENRDDPDSLLTLAKELPFASASIEAAQLAVDRMLDQGRRHDALGELFNVYRLSERRAAASSLLGRAAQLCMDSGWPREAEQIVRYVRDHMGDVMLNGSAGPRSTETWLQQIAVLTNPRHAARIGEPDGRKVRELEGNLLPLTDLRNPTSHDTFVIAREGNIRLFSTNDLAAKWSIDLPEPATAVVTHDSNGLLLWQASNPPDGRAIMLDPANGTTRWTTPSLLDALGDESNEMIRSSNLRDQMPGGELFNPAETIPLVNRNQLILVRRIGGVLAYDLKTGAPLWSHKETLDQVHIAKLCDTALVLAGINRARTGSTQSIPSIVVIEPATGRIVGRYTTFENEPARWVQLAPLGRVVYGTDTSIDAIDIFSARRAWTNSSYDATETLDGWPLADQIMFQERSRLLRTIAVDSGEMSDPFDGAVRADQWDPYDLQKVLVDGDAIYVTYPQRVVRYSDRGRIEGQDVVVDERSYRWLIQTDDRMIIVSSQSMQSMVPDEAGRRSLIYRYRLYMMTRDCKLIGNAYDLADQFSQANSWRAVNNWLLVGRENGLTLAIPMPAPLQP